MSPGPTFDRVYVAIKSRLLAGLHAPGDHLEPAVIGEALSSSITPVRDALHRLVGEGLVDAPRHNGFQVRSPTEAELRDLYDWNQRLLELALRRRPPSALTGPDVSGPGEPATIAQLFLKIGEATGSGEHRAAIAALNDRLAAVRLAEELVVASAGEELASLAAGFDRQDYTGLRRSLAAYHRRRKLLTPDLLVALRRRAGAGAGAANPP